MPGLFLIQVLHAYFKVNNFSSWDTNQGVGAKGLTQKEVTMSLKMDASQYARIENGKTDPSFTIVAKIAKALGVSLAELFEADSIFTGVNSAD